MTNTTPALATLQLTVRAVVRNSREFKQTEGPHTGEVYFSADAELATPGNRWSTLRLKVRGRSRIAEGEQTLVIESMDGNKGEGVAHVA